MPLKALMGGSGKRQVILSKEDPVSKQLHTMTRGVLPPGAVFDWHIHENIDEFFYVLNGMGKISYEDKTEFGFKKGDLIYSPSNLSHRIENTGTEDNEFFFIRLNH